MTHGSSGIMEARGTTGHLGKDQRSRTPADATWERVGLTGR